MEGFIANLQAGVSEWLASLAPGPLASLSLLQKPLPVPTAPPPKEPEERKRGRFGLGRRKKAEQHFSCQVTVHPPAQQAQCHELVTTGSKIWGIGMVLPIAKIYDYGVYINSKQAKASQLAAQFQGEQLVAAPRSNAFYASLRSSNDIDFSLVVRATRNLPIRLVAAEYRRILRRRLAAMGASPDDDGLVTMLQAFSEERLPASVKQGSCVAKGTTLLFTKHSDGVLVAHANGEPIAKVRSPPLCAAIMDLYLGPDKPVSSKARRVAGESIVRIMGGAPGEPRARLPCSLESQVCKLRA